MFFFLLPVGVEYQTSRWPVVTFSLIGTCILVHIWAIVLMLSSTASYEWWMQMFWFTPAHFSVLTIFTSMFVHGSIFHLLGNMVYLFLFGATTEDRIGRGRFLALYFIGGAVAALMHVAFTPEHFASDIPLGGASGAISACMGAFLCLFPKLRVEFKYFGLVFFRPYGGEFAVKGWIVMSFYFLSDLAHAVLGMLNGSGGSGTAFGAHVGGFILGMTFALALKAWWKSHPDPAEALQRATVPAQAIQHALSASGAHAAPRAQVTARKVIRVTEDRPYLVFQSDEQFGPYSIEEIIHYHGEGAISPGALFWKAGMEDWLPVTSLSDQVAS